VILLKETDIEGQTPDNTHTQPVRIRLIGKNLVQMNRDRVRKPAQFPWTRLTQLQNTDLPAVQHEHIIILAVKIARRHKFQVVIEKPGVEIIPPGADPEIVFEPAEGSNAVP